MRYLVIDRNTVRREHLSIAANDTQSAFVITDTFLVEMVKHPSLWAKTVRKDFLALTPFRDRLEFSLSLSEVVRKEWFEGGATNREQLLPFEFRTLLDELMQAAVSTDELRDPLLRKIAALLPALCEEQPAINLAKIRTEMLIQEVRRMVTPETVTRLRNGRLQGRKKLLLVEYIAREMYEANCAKQKVEVLAMSESVVSRIFTLKVWRALWWLAHNGLEQAADEKVNNDSYDDEYILIASFFDGILSAENRVNEADEALRRIVKIGQSED